MHWAFFPQAGPQSAVNLVDCVHWGNALSQRGEWPQRVEHVAEVAVGKRVMQQPAFFGGKQWGSAGDGDQRDVFAGSPGQAIECGELADAVGRQQARDPAGAGIAVGSIRSVELVGAAHKADAVGSFDLFQPVQVEIARHANDFRNTDFFQATNQKISDGHSHV